jgi:glyoxylase-like metal-dependent hydrolase (beta-lactamase superfamily II)
MVTRIDRIHGNVMAVNSYLVHGPDGIVVVDGMLTISDAHLVRDAVAESGKPLAAIVITHPHPDHYAGAGEIAGQAAIPIIATEAVDRIIRRDDDVKNTIVGPMMGDEWPTDRPFPNQITRSGETVRVGGLELTVTDVGPGESHADTIWSLDDTTLFPGDIAYNNMHAYLADGTWLEWLKLLERLENDLPANAVLYVGHGEPGDKTLIAAQRRYVAAFADAVVANADAVAIGDHTPVLDAMRKILPNEDLLFLTDLSIEPVLAILKSTGAASP